MPKPRKKLTWLKHLGTKIAHPTQYRRYKRYKEAFITERHLPLRKAYRKERRLQEHPYPKAIGTTVRETGVIYPEKQHHRHTVVRPGTDLMTAPAYDHQASSGVGERQLGKTRGDLVTLRREKGDPVIRMAKKRDVHGSVTHPNVGRTQHSTLTGGKKVGAAALRRGGEIRMSSGHYRPKEKAAVKLAIAGKLQGVLNRRDTDFKSRDGKHIFNLTMKRRMQVVSEWARGGP